VIEVLGALVLLGILTPIATNEIETNCRDRRQRKEARNRPAPGLSSQKAQIKSLSSAAIKLGKKPYLGPKRKK